MKQYLLLSITLLFYSSFNLNAQNYRFQESFNVPGSYVGLGIQEIPGGCIEKGDPPGYIIITNSYAVIRTDIEGNILWTKQYNYPKGGFSDYIELVPGCSFIVAGSVIDSNNRKSFNLIKLDGSGNII